MRVRWSEAAAQHAEDIYLLLARNNPDAAIATVDKLIAFIEQLSSYPQLGRSSELGTRKLIQPPFVVFYRIVDDVVSIEAILHGSRKDERWVLKSTALKA